MANPRIITALDIGTSTVETVVAERVRGSPDLKILGLGLALSAGVRRGIIIDLEEAASAVRKSVDEARHSAGVPIDSVWLAIGGSHVVTASSHGMVAVSRADGEISPEDIRRVIAAAETFVARNPNKEILHMIPRDFRVDREGGVRDPVGMYGVRLEVDTLIIEGSTSFLKNLFKCVESAGLRVADYVFAPLAAAEAVLTKRQKELGVMLLDIGGGTASFMVFEEGMPIHAGVVPIGGGQITNDLAIGFRTHIDVAEQIKLAHGSCLPGLLTKKESIRLADFIPSENATFARRELAEIVEARLRDIFELLQKELKRIDRKQLLPAGVVLIGGSARLPGLLELTKSELGLPVELGTLRQSIVGNIDERFVSAFLPALGVAEWANMRLREPASTLWDRTRRMSQSRWFRWLKSLLP